MGGREGQNKKKKKKVGYTEARNDSSRQTMTFIGEIFVAVDKSTWLFISIDDIIYLKKKTQTKKVYRLPLINSVAVV